MRTVLFVCTGNTCRSPMAEAIARHELERGRPALSEEVFVASAGVMAADGVRTAPETVRALAVLGIELDGRSKPLSVAMASKADVILCMTTAHRDEVIAMLGERTGDVPRVEVLDPEGDLPDPIGLGQDAYDALAARLTEIIPARLKELLHGEDRPRIRSSG